MAWFGRKKEDSLDPQYLLAQAEAQTRAQTQAPSQTRAQASAPQPAVGQATGFRLTVEDVFVITGRGTVVTGRVAAGTITKGSTVRQTRPDGTVRDLTVTGIEMFRKTTDSAAAGDNVGLLLRDVGRDDVGRGDVLSA
jgi:translation elongation factor EF-Tu-like GTPase